MTAARALNAPPLGELSAQPPEGVAPPLVQPATRLGPALCGADPQRHPFSPSGTAPPEGEHLGAAAPGAASTRVVLTPTEQILRDLMGPDPDLRARLMFAQLETAARQLAVDHGDREAARMLRRAAQKLDGRTFVPADGSAE